MSNENTINRIKANKVRELEGQVASIIDAKRATTNYKGILDEKEKEIKNLKDELKILHFQPTDSKDLIDVYQERDKSQS
jgi:phosphosulfolactate phosphohydrolase-like enzyme